MLIEQCSALPWGLLTGQRQQKLDPSGNLVVPASRPSPSLPHRPHPLPPSADLRRGARPDGPPQADARHRDGWRQPPGGGGASVQGGEPRGGNARQAAGPPAEHQGLHREEPAGEAGGQAVWLVGRQVNGRVGGLAGWLAGWQAGWLAGWLAVMQVDWLFGRQA